MGSKTNPTRVWRQLLATALLSPLLILAWWLYDSLAFVQETTETGAGIFWSDSQATLNLRVGCPPNRLLTEWGPCWDDAAEDAAAQWNAVGAKFRFRIQPPSQQASVACTSNDVDGLTTVVWADAICGKTFNSSTLATTRLWFRMTGELVDSDVLFNTASSWTTYSGPPRSGVIDFHRIAIHEFGHVLGLDHPDDYGQSVNALMNGRLDATDRLQTDDINGIIAIYGRRSTGSTRKGNLENPDHGAFKSGIGLISGWMCEASRVEVIINGQRVPVVYGTDRGDTRSQCGGAANGFVTLFNWNRLGDGVYTARALADGVEFDRSTFQVATFGQEFLRGASGAYRLPDFPRDGTTTAIEWEESTQNFVIREVR